MELRVGMRAMPLSVALHQHGGWKAGEAGAGMEMDVNPVETSGKQKGRAKGEPQHKLGNNTDVDMASLGGRDNVKQKGKGKLVRIDEDKEMETLATFVVPALPA